MPYSMMLDAGHGGRDPGAVYQGRQEKDDNLRLTLAVGQILQDNGIDVEYTRTTDIYLSPLERAQLANEAGVDFFVSIHRNSFPTDNTVSGVETLVYDKTGIKYQMAQNINEQLETIGFVNLGVQARPNLIVLRRTKMPALLVEAGFLNSDSDNLLFDRNFQDIAQAIASGILDTLEFGNHSDSGMLPPRPPQTSNYRVQTGAFRTEAYANRLRDELIEMDFPARIEDSGGFFRVLVGSFKTVDEASAMEQRLKRAGYQTVIVT